MTTSAPVLDADAMQDAIAKATGKQFGAAARAAGTRLNSNVNGVKEEEEEGSSGSGSESEAGEGAAQARAGDAGGGPSSASVASPAVAVDAGAKGRGSRPGANGIGAAHTSPAKGSGQQEGDADGEDAVSVLPAMEEEAGSGGAAGVSAAEGGVSAAERAEIAALLAEENAGPELDDAAKERLTVLDSLTGIPRAEDLLLSAIPVCGPYQVSSIGRWRQGMADRE